MKKHNHHSLCLTPPMGWNSWDCYGAAVTEDVVRKNADYMAKNLKKYGWEYVIVEGERHEGKDDDEMEDMDVELEGVEVHHEKDKESKIDE